jgi:hypothetical protein
MRRNLRWKVVALLAAGIAIGVVMVGTPAGAHVSSWAHNWNKHIKPKAAKLAGRAAVEQAAGVPVNTTGAFGTIVDVKLRAPKKGFVLVTGTARLDGGTTCPCEAGMRLNSGGNSSFIYRLSKTDPTHSDTTTISFLFPASKGLHTYRVQLDERSGDLAGATSDATITALFVPYGAAGGTSPAARIAPAQAQSEG